MSNTIQNIPKIQPIAVMQLDKKKPLLLTQESRAKITHISFCLGAIVTTAGVIAFVASFLFASLAVAAIFITTAQLIAVPCLVVGSAALTASIVAKILRTFEVFVESIKQKKQLMLWQKQLKLTQSQLDQMKTNFNQGRAQRLSFYFLLSSHYQALFREAVLLQRNLNRMEEVNQEIQVPVVVVPTEPEVLRNDNLLPEIVVVANEELAVPANDNLPLEVDPPANEELKAPAAAPKKAPAPMAKGPAKKGPPPLAPKGSGKKAPPKGTGKKGPPPPIPTQERQNVNVTPKPVDPNDKQAKGSSLWNWFRTNVNG